MPTAKSVAFARLHESGCFVIPNPWDIGSARYLQSLGFEALASTSAGMAWSLGRPDTGVDIGSVLAHLAALAAATDLPLNADFEHGFAETPEGVATNVRRAVETGIAGLSMEDSTGDLAQPILPLQEAVRRIAAARTAIDATGSGVLLTGRAENFITGRPDIADTISRLQAYARAGADCLYAPGIRTAQDIAAVVQAVAPKPVNFLTVTTEFSVADLAGLGVRRISVGGALARTAWGGFIRAATQIVQDGRFDSFADAAPGATINGIFRE